MEKIWTKLEAHRAKTKDNRITDLFNDPGRFENYSATLEDMVLDYSKTSIDDTAMALLLKLAGNIEEKRDAMFRGDKINTTENRSVLHTALRNSTASPVFEDGEDVMPGVRDTLDRMRKFANAVRFGEICAADGKPFTDVINIGIGGSDLGPVMVSQALAPYHDGPKTHFISNIDGAHICDVLSELNAKRTLVIVASKTFTTVETMVNAHTIQNWLKDSLGDDISDHLVGLSSALDKTAEFGIRPERVFSFEDWVGGRYSIWGPIGLSLMLAIGPRDFDQFLQGAEEMDTHFRETPLAQNLPVMLALVGIWHNNICGYPTRAILPYDQRLLRLPAYLQQLDMESNGKRVTHDGTRVTRATGPIIWGEVGTGGQHAFYQLIHQGTSIIPCEFLIAAKGHEPHLQRHHNLLLSNCLAQTRALMRGRSIEDAGTPFREFEGNRPSITLLYRMMTPRTLGRILALYEHRIFVEGCIWNINSFDQWGVELGKELAAEMLPMIEGETDEIPRNSSTAGLLDFIKKLR